VPLTSALVQVREHREDAPVVTRVGREAQLGEDVPNKTTRCLQPGRTAPRKTCS
jgi:hypothetical protein